MSARFNPGPNGSAGAGGSLVQGYTDNSGTPGNTTINTPSGRAAIASTASTCVVTCAACVATSKVLVTPLTNDTTGVPLSVTTTAAGSFTVTAKAAATANLPFNFLVVN